MTWRQYSGAEHCVIRGIGLISCVYVNGETGQFWVIDYHLYDPNEDGHSKLDQVAQILNGMVYSKQLPFTTVLMDSWYATQKLMAQIDQLGKVYYCPLKCNRRVDWSRFKSIAYQTGKTVYQLKHGMLSNHLIEQLKHLSVQTTLA